MFDREEFMRRMGRDNYAELSGMEVIAAAPGFAEVRMPVVEKVLNGHGNLHGGALFTLADYTAAIASNMLGEATMAVNGSVSFLRAVRGGQVTATAKVVKEGGRMNFMVVDIHDAEGRLVATFQGAAMKVGKREAKTA